jgi:hypothetical protein
MCKAVNTRGISISLDIMATRKGLLKRLSKSSIVRGIVSSDSKKPVSDAKVQEYSFNHLSKVSPSMRSVQWFKPK